MSICLHENETCEKISRDEQLQGPRYTRESVARFAVLIYREGERSNQREMKMQREAKR